MLNPDPYQIWIRNPGAAAWKVESDRWIQSGFRIRICINLSCWIRIRIQIADPDPDPGGEKITPKKEKRTEFSSFEVLDVHF
jgi:hypothetical protein